MPEPIIVVHPRHRGWQASQVARAARPKTQSAHHTGHPGTTDRLYDADEQEFLVAVDRFKNSTGKKFPTVAELLGVLKSLGYAKPGPELGPESLANPAEVLTYTVWPAGPAGPAASLGGVS
jgi:hypothetical protein